MWEIVLGTLCVGLVSGAIIMAAVLTLRIIIDSWSSMR
jgi:hypothetical protein